ncbi:hypothetical protein BZA05DRAFT_406350 [Tricharina praecox]|uniref:uncharacterized protein n=1 Tax=Tricharina praecox TaxID=43433 RepID=UPI002220B40E|nr:uncharacterized protein BZA05DRAFT_406350 [Tricharina praecox]KAI5846702.1 hypothetical protein BZA05DRAFT_406350 [Tricharina praecox]
MSVDSGNSSPYSEIATEPLPENEQLQIHDYMNRRSIFLSDFERYNPVQNMQMLAHHVFELSEGVGRMKNDLTESRRMVGFVSDNQRQHDTSIRHVGSDLNVVHHKVDTVGNALGETRAELKNDIGGLREDINSLRSEMHSIRQETQQGIMDLKQLLMSLAPLRA